MAYSAEVMPTEERLEVRRRRLPRQVLRSLAYVRLDEANGGIIRDLSQSGLGLQAVAALHREQEVELRFELLQPRVRLDVRGRVRWADRSGQGGIEFLGLASRSERALRDWLFTQILASAALTGRDSILSVDDTDLRFSTAARRSIVIPSPPAAVEGETQRVNWSWFSLSTRSFALFVDALVLLCSVLLFAIGSIAVMGGMPEWPFATALLLTAATIFVAVYHILFSDFFCRQTPGKRLALLAAASPDEDDETDRFR